MAIERLQHRPSSVEFQRSKVQEVNKAGSGFSESDHGKGSQEKQRQSRISAAERFSKDSFQAQLDAQRRKREKLLGKQEPRIDTPSRQDVSKNQEVINSLQHQSRRKQGVNMHVFGSASLETRLQRQLGKTPEEVGIDDMLKLQESEAVKQKDIVEMFSGIIPETEAARWEEAYQKGNIQYIKSRIGYYTKYDKTDVGERIRQALENEDMQNAVRSLG